jgi:hypothetical protein
MTSYFIEQISYLAELQIHTSLKEHYSFLKNRYRDISWPPCWEYYSVNTDSMDLLHLC